MIDNDLAIHRRSGVRLFFTGLALLVIGLLVLVISNHETGGDVTHPEIARGGRGVSLLAGFPATLGYVMSALGLYRWIRGRGPGHSSQSVFVLVLRAAFVVATVALFSIGAFYIVMHVRDPAAPLPRPAAP